MSQYSLPVSAETKAALRPFICRAAALPPQAARESLSNVVANGAAEIFPDLVIALAVHVGDQVDFLADQSIAPLGGVAAVLPLGVENLHGLQAPQVETMQATEGRADSTISILSTREPFCASRICDLDDLLARTFGVTPTHGVLLSIPTWRAVILHLPTGAGVLTAVQLMARVAFGVLNMAPESVRLDPDVYFIAPDRRIQRVARAIESEGIRVETHGLIGEVLFGPAGLVQSEFGEKRG
jgi:hypothetical protein